MTKLNAPRNPYIVGRSIHEQDKLFGRESLLNSLSDILQNYFIENNENQNQTQNFKVILLEGQRRIGKTSVLEQIKQRVSGNNCAFVSFDLQSHSTSPLSQILHDLAQKIIEDLEYESTVIAPIKEDFDTDLDIFYRDFLPIIYQNIENRNLILLLDEFDTVYNDDFHNIFQKILIHHPQLCIITVIGRNMIISERLSSFFKDSPQQLIDVLDNPSAKSLITQRLTSPLKYEQNAITKIIQLTAGHPYFTQVICFALFVQARNNNGNVTSEDVSKIIPKALEMAEAHLPSFWNDWSILEKVVMSTVAEAQKRAFEQNQVEPKEPFNLLKEYGIIQTDELNNASKRLEQSGYIYDAKRKIKVELIRQWLLEKHRFYQEIQELTKFNQEEVNPICDEANSLYQQGKRQEAITRYEDALKINPNNFNTVCALANACLEVENFERAIELYTRANQFEPIRNKEKLVDALQKSGDKLRSKGQLSQAKVQFEQILKIESDNQSANNQSAKETIRQIETEIAYQNKLQIDSENKSAEQDKRREAAQSQKLSYPWRVLLGTIAAAGILAVGIVVNRWSTPCLAGQLKVNSFSCVPDSFDISRGEDKLFPGNSNSNLDQGIAEFKKGNYSQAAEFFKAAKDQTKDPEALIYYNNALARKKGKPLTLAVAVPVDNEQPQAKEILRGVAQAQNQFNDNNGLNGQLLEIAIANDANKPNKAKSIAQELVKNPSILGVIGHFTSDTTTSALDEYKKAGLSIVSPTSTSTSLKSDVFFRTVPSDAAAGKKLAEYARISGINRVVIFYNPHSTYSNSLTEAFIKNFGGFSKKIDLSKPNMNIEQELQESAQNAQTAMLFPNSETRYLNKALDIAKANSNLGVNRLKLLGGDAMYSQETLTNGDIAIQGLIIAVPWVKDSRNAKTFIKAASQQWGTESVSWRTATSYDATQAFIQALSPNASRSTVLKALPNVNLTASATSGDALQFQNGERQIQPILVKVENGQFKFLQ